MAIGNSLFSTTSENPDGFSVSWGTCKSGRGLPLAMLVGGTTQPLIAGRTSRNKS